jgi:hypothetical protein
VGLVSTLAGVTVFLALLFLAVHLLLNLFLTSVVTAVTWDAARLAAGNRGDVASAEAHARALLGERAESVSFAWGASAGAVTLTVRARGPDLLWPGLMEAVGVEEVSRTVTVRAEEFDAP